jgi:regulator of protease activity HflC (stomatin/prohibitin superfamily)
LPKRIGRLSGHGRSTGKRQMSFLARQRPENKVIHAEGEAQAAEKLAEAANIISVYPAAIHLRFLQTITKVAAEKNSTTILPLPIDLLTAFLQKKDNE